MGSEHIGQQACYSSTQEGKDKDQLVKAIQGYSVIFETTLGYEKPCASQNKMDTFHLPWIMLLKFFTLLST